MRLRHLARVAASLVREAVKRRTRSPRWRSTERTYLALFPTCAACGGKRMLQVHHEKPVSTHPELELAPSNLITLCMGSMVCHFVLGHLGNWRQSNPYVRQDAALLLERRKAAVRP